MFKGFQSKSRQFNGFPNLNFQVNNEAYGFSGCTFWLDAAYGLNTQTDLAAVSIWQTKIGGLTFIQATAGNQPRYKVNNVSYNNYPTIDFYDSSRRITTNDFILIPNNFLVAFVANYNTLSGANALLGSSLSLTPQLLLGGSGADMLGVCWSDPTRRSGTTDSTTVKIGIVGNDRIVVNGNTEYNGTLNTTTVAFNQIGALGTGTNFPLIGSVAEIIIFNRRFTDTEITTLSDRLNSKYAIY